MKSNIVWVVNEFSDWIFLFIYEVIKIILLIFYELTTPFFLKNWEKIVSWKFRGNEIYYRLITVIFFFKLILQSNKYFFINLITIDVSIFFEKVVINWFKFPQGLFFFRRFYNRENIRTEKQKHKIKSHEYDKPRRRTTKHRSQRGDHDHNRTSVC